MALEPVEGLNLIDGQWLRGEAAAWERLSPGDGSLLGRGHWASPAQGLAAVAAARRAFDEWSERPLDERMAICRNFAMLVTESKHELACLIATETGKPLWEAETEVAATIAKVENSIDALMTRRWTTTQAIGDYLAVTRYRPHGVLFVIGPFNFPAHIPGGHIVPALLAGNTLGLQTQRIRLRHRTMVVSYMDGCRLAARCAESGPWCGGSCLGDRRG